MNADQTHYHNRLLTLHLSGFIMAMALACTVPTHAQDAVWTGVNSADWFDPGNWGPAGVPVNGNWVDINTVTPNGTIVDGLSADVGFFRIGVSNEGMLTIQNAGVVNSSGGIIGRTGTGTVAVTGAGSTWNTRNLFVATEGTGTLIISDGGVVNSTGTLIASEPGSIGAVTVTGVGSTLSDSQTVVVGNGGDSGTLTIENGGLVSTGEGVIGVFSIGSSTATVTGNGSTWINSADLFVGSNGDGTLTIADGGVVSNASGRIGNFSDSNGAVTVTGVGSAWTNSSDLRVGISGNSGVLTIADRGTVNVTGALTLGEFSATGALNIGNGGAAGILNAANVNGGDGGATLNFNHTDSGYFFTNDGTGTGAAIDITGSTAVSHSNTGTTILTGNNTYTGGTTINQGTLQAGAAGAFVNNAAYAVNGGSLDLNGFGLSMSSLSGTGGVVDLGTAILTVNQSSDTTFMGDITGSGNLIKENSGAMTLFGTADYSGGTNIRSGGLTVDGGEINHPGAGTIIGDNLAFSNGFLRVTNGGTVSNTTGIIGRDDFSIGQVQVDGPGSSWNNSSYVLVGNVGFGTLTIENGGTVNSGSAFVGNVSLSGSFGQAVVDNGGWNNTGDFRLGSSGIGSLDILNDGIVTVGGTLTLAHNAGSAGTLNIGTGGAAGILSTANVIGGDGTAILNFNHIEGDYFFTNDGTASGTAVTVSGSTDVNHIGTGTTTLTGSHTYTGNTSIDNGNLLVNGSLVSDTFVGDGGTLGGSGDIAATVTVADNATLAPGTSPGALNFGELTLNDASSLDFELDAPTGNPGVDNDLVNVVADLNGSGSTGNLTLDGILNITDLGGFDFGVTSGDNGSYRLINYDGTLTDNGLTFGTGLRAGYHYQIDTFTANQINLNVDFTGLQFWDGAGVVADDSVGGGGGTWDIVSTNWTNENGDRNHAWSELTAVFSGTGDTVEVDGSHTVTGLHFASDGYTLDDTDSNGAMALGTGSAELRIDNGLAVTVAVGLAGNGQLIKTGLGVATLTGNNTYSGGTAVRFGTLVVEGGGADHTSADTIVGDQSGDDATLNITNGGIVNNAIGFIGKDAGSIGIVSVTGVSSEWNNSGNLFVGSSGSGTLEITGGSTVNVVGSLTLANNAGSSGTLNIGNGGTAGVLNTSNVIGGDGTATLNFDHSDAEYFLTNDGTAAGTAVTINGSTSVNQLGTGTTVLTGVNDYTGGTSINAGTLKAGVTGAFANNTAYIVNGGTLDLNGFSLTMSSLSGTGGTVDLTNAALTVDQADVSEFAGVVTGNGSLTKENSGVLTLAGSNDYSGGTIISAGTLRIGNGGTSGSITGNVTNDAVLAFNRSDNLTFNGLISGTGTVQQMGAGELELTNADNDYTGGTMVDGGTLRIGATGATGNGTITLLGSAIDYADGVDEANAVDLRNNASLNVDTGSVSQSGDIGETDGTFGITKTGNGEMVLTGNNTYSGGTAVDAGILRGDTNSLRGDIVNNATLVFDQAGDGSFTDVISGTGSLNKKNAGSLTLSGNNIYTGDTIIEAGTVLVNGSLSGDTFVHDGATLGGSGNLGNVTVNGGGTLDPGNSPGTMNMSGSLMLDSRSLTRMEINGLTPGEDHDQINVTGTATLDGTLELDFGFVPSGGDRFNLINAAEFVLNGDSDNGFATITDNLGAALLATPVIDPTSFDLLVELTQQDFAVAAEGDLTGNQRGVAASLDNLASSGGARDLVGALNRLPAHALPRAFNSLSGVQQTHGQVLGIGLPQNFSRRLSQRLGGRGRFVGGLISPYDMLLAYNGDLRSYEVAAANLVQARDESRRARGFWFQGFGGVGEIDDTTRAVGTDYTTRGIVLGLDTDLRDHYTVGAAFGYTQTDSDSPGSDLDVDSIQGTLYGDWQRQGYKVNGALSVGYHDTDARRRVVVGSFDETARADYDSWTITVMAESSRDYHVTDNATVTPFAGLEYTRLQRDDFTETGAGDANLTFDKEDQDSVRSNLGLRVEWTRETADGLILIPSLEAGWVHEYLDDESTINAAFAAAPAARFRVEGPELDRDRARVRAGIAARRNDRFSLIVGYYGDLAGSDETHTISATAWWRW